MNEEFLKLLFLILRYERTDILQGSAKIGYKHSMNVQIYMIMFYAHFKKYLNIRNYSISFHRLIFFSQVTF